MQDGCFVRGVAEKGISAKCQIELFDRPPLLVTAMSKLEGNEALKSSVGIRSRDTEKSGRNLWKNRE